MSNIKFDNFSNTETELLNKVRELRELLVKYYQNTEYTTIHIFENTDDRNYRSISIVSYKEHKDKPDLDLYSTEEYISKED